MLLELKVRDLAIIESVDIKFSFGLNVLTGETGAGKSILLEALNLVLGGRSDRDLIRTGKKEAWAEALFEVNEKILPFIKEWGIAIEDDEPLALRRVIQSNGRSRAYINCVSVSANLLKLLAPLLIDYSKQHEQSILLNPEKHLDLIDQCGGLDKERENLEICYKNLISLIQEQKKLSDSIKARQEKREFLTFQYNSIMEVDPQENEEEELTEELENLSNKEKCREIAKAKEYELYSSGDSIQSKLSSIINDIRELVDIDDSIIDILENLENALITIEETSRTLQIYKNTVKLNPEKIEEINERLNEVIKIQNKYGGSYESVKEKLKRIKEELEELKKEDLRLQEINEVIKKAKSELCNLSLPLTEKRKQISDKLCKNIELELKDLAMKDAIFKINIKSLSTSDPGKIICKLPNSEKTIAIGPYGAETAKFLLSANKGEELRPLENVASGGELSRILLALRRVLANVSSVETFVFDEIDSGISGITANLLAQKLVDIVSGKYGKKSQVILISHTAQIAAKADRHFYVEKQIRENRTHTKVSLLNNDVRLKEIARMLSGNLSGESLELAKELIKR